MVSPSGRRGKGIGCAGRPVVPATPEPTWPFGDLVGAPGSQLWRWFGLLGHVGSIDRELYTFNRPAEASPVSPLAGEPRAVTLVLRPMNRHTQLMGWSHTGRWPSRRTKPRDELPPVHSVTSSARTRRDVGKVMPSALATLTLRANSAFVDSCTGRSAGFSPLRIRPV
jgi:hypothetical protein